jgi:hypothetical protein
MQTGEGKTLTAAFPAYLNNYPAARPPVEKMLVIDRLIHEFHYSFKALPDQSTRPVGVNLIKRESHVRKRRLSCLYFPSLLYRLIRMYCLYRHKPSVSFQ